MNEVMKLFKELSESLEQRQPLILESFYTDSPTVDKLKSLNIKISDLRELINDNKLIINGIYLTTQCDDDKYGKLIIQLEDEETFERRTFKIWDGGQCCCEYRYMSTDDDLQSIVGGKLLNIEIKDGPDSGDSYTVTECQFLEITTDKGFVTIKNYNEHNGYYGGFDIKIEEDDEYE